MGVWESDSIDKNFDEIIKEVEKMKNMTINKFKTLEESTNISKIQKFDSLAIEGIKVSKSEGSSWYDKAVYVRLDITYEANKYIEDNKIPTTGINYDSSWKILKVKIEENNESNLNSLIAFVEALAKSEEEKHQKNIRKKQINEKTKNQIFILLKQVGVSDTYYGYKTNRSRDTTKMSYNFPVEIGKQIPTNYSENQLEEKKKNIIQEIKNVWNTESRKIRDTRIAKEKEQKEKENNKILALLLAKYDLEITDSWDSLLYEIIQKNKYLYLAHYLEKNRGDWSDGYSYAENGLRNFDTESELDREICDDIQSYIDDWGGDGRVFRDCKYNFDVLFGIASEQDPQLYKDYAVVKENVGDD